MNWMKNIRGAFVCLLVFSGLNAFSQNLKEDMAQFYKLFLSTERIECKFTSSAYKLNEDNVPMMKKDVRVCIDHDNYFYDMGEMVCLINKRVVVYVDKSTKRIIIGKNNPQELD
jgi:hypothetical protein